MSAEMKIISDIKEDTTRLIKAIAGDLDDPEKTPGLQSEVRGLKADMVANAGDHKIFRKAFAVVAVFIILDLGLAAISPNTAEVIGKFIAALIN